jgi:hypothetical protein
MKPIPCLECIHDTIFVAFPVHDTVTVVQRVPSEASGLCVLLCIIGGLTLLATLGYAAVKLLNQLD